MVWFGFAAMSSDTDATELDASSSGNGPQDAPQTSDSDEVSGGLLRFLPWGVSMLVHLGVVLLAFFIVWSVIDRSEKETAIIPIARLSEVPGTPVTLQTATKMKRSSDSPRSMQTSDATPRSAIQRLVNTESKLVGVLGQSAGGSNPFRSDISTGAGFETQFFGIGGNARRLVYLIDASGSLMDTFDFVILELKRSINDLSPQQSFTVIFFQAANKLPVEVPPLGMRPATSQNKVKVIKWIDREEGNIHPEWSTDPIPALKMALRYQPQLVFILSDNITGHGPYEVDQRRLLREIEKANKGQAAINTIQFIYRDTLERHGLKPTLEEIADHNGGIYKFVDAKELGIE